VSVNCHQHTTQYAHACTNAKFEVFHVICVKPSGVRRNFFWVGFIQWHRVVICIWCALFVMSQNDVIVLFPNQRFGEVC